MNWRMKDRQTGRTTRMIQAAVKAAINGSKVHIIVHSLREVDRIRRVLHDMHASALDISVSPPADPWWSDDDTLRPRGVHPDAKVFIDHHAVRERYSNILDMYHRWDRWDVPPEEES